MFFSSTPISLVLMLVVSYVIPAVSALLTPARVPAWVIGVVTPVLSALAGFLTEAGVDPGNYDWGHGAILAVASAVIAIVGHKITWQGPLTERLHALWPHASTSSIDAMINAGVGVITPLVSSHAPLVTGNAAPAQTSPAPSPQPTPEPAAAPVDPPAPVPTPEPMPTPQPAPAAPAPAPTAPVEPAPVQPAAVETTPAPAAPSLPEIAAQLNALQAQVTAALGQPATQ